MQPIKQPSRPGGIYEHARRSAEYARMHGAAGAGGYLTTKGFIPNPRKKAKASRNAATPLVWAS